MTNSNSNKIDTIKNFQPMPKRFMVWDDEATDWICVPGTERDIWGIVDLLTHKTGLMRHKFHMKIVQSTNFFDKDGTEIFEGSIVENVFINKSGCVYYDEDVAGWRVLYGDFTWDDLYYVRSDIEVVDHILSNPELLDNADV